MKTYLHLADAGLLVSDLSLRIYRGDVPVSAMGVTLDPLPGFTTDYALDNIPNLLSPSDALTVTFESPIGVYNAYRFGAAETQPTQVIIPIREIFADPLNDLSIELFTDGVGSAPSVSQLASDGEYLVSGWGNTSRDVQRSLRWVYNDQVYAFSWVGTFDGISGTFYQEITAVQSPFSYGVDAQDRVLFSCNYLVRALSPINTLEDDIEQILRAGLIISSDEILYTGPRVTVPDGDGPISTIIATGGHQSDETHNSKRDNPGFQIITRATDYNIAREQAISIYQYLDTLRSVLVTP